MSRPLDLLLAHACMTMFLSRIRCASLAYTLRNMRRGKRPVASVLVLVGTGVYCMRAYGVSGDAECQ